MTTDPLAPPDRPERKQDEMPDELARSGTREIRDPQPAAVTDAGNQKDCAGTGHTRGPWHDDGYRIYAPTDDADKRNGRVIVEYKHVEDFNPFDAPLIAAAPDLLVALKRAVDWLASYPADSCLTSARAAIAKAEGR